MKHVKAALHSADQFISPWLTPANHLSDEKTFSKNTAADPTSTTSSQRGSAWIFWLFLSHCFVAQIMPQISCQFGAAFSPHPFLRIALGESYAWWVHPCVFFNQSEPQPWMNGQCYFFSHESGSTPIQKKEILRVGVMFCVVSQPFPTGSPRYPDWWRPRYPWSFRSPNSVPFLSLRIVGQWCRWCALYKLYI